MIDAPHLPLVISECVHVPLPGGRRVTLTLHNDGTYAAELFDVSGNLMVEYVEPVHTLADKLFSEIQTPPRKSR